MKHRLAVFDFDGTLADSFPFFLASFGELARAHGFRPLDRGNLDELRRLDARQLMRHVGLPAWKVPLVAMDFRRLMAARTAQITLFDGMPALLRDLADAGVELAVLSSNSRENVQAVLGPALSGLIRHLDCGVSLLGKKRKLRALLNRTGFAPGQTVCVGDEIRDIEAARGVRAAAAAVGWGYTLPDALAAHQPDTLAHTVAQLRDYLERA
ncbi:HAD hydrolase-like protein [Noviherbaspirillum sp. 1P10PC]|uniref:HAD hydrolase-like protein n=1 Tax=Noviherbaspirillum sp. 1P10PC TaxID=3132292 RepID=UPI0039A1E342